jgi:hypothetical protein
VGAEVKVLIACEYSGRVRDAFIKLGHDAISCDLLPTESPGPHYQGSVLDIINWSHLRRFDFEDGHGSHSSWFPVGTEGNALGFDLMIAHPPCTYLAVSGLHWNKRNPERAIETEKALEFVKTLMNVAIPSICIENPVSCISTRIRKPDQIIQPWWFGEDASKKTCLWLKGLPLLTPTNIIKKDRYANQTASGQNNLGPSPDRWKIRSTTYQGIADAMANQWGRK